MKIFACFRAFPLLCILSVAVAPFASAAADRALKPSPTVSFESTALLNVLENWHYNRQAVKPKDFSQVLPEYMAQLDGQHLFFLKTDLDNFAKQYPAQWLYNNVSALGKIDPAYTIFNVYENRVEARVSWILEQLKGPIDLTTHDSLVIDRSKLSWPASSAESDELWKRHLTFEVVQEMLNKKTADQAKENVRKRYERMLKNLDDIESSDISEMFLSTIAQIYDPHSTYFSADTYEDFSIQLRLQLVGIGALLSVEDNECVVKELITGGPADLSKQLHPNDKIISVSLPNGEQLEVMGLKLRKIVERIRGEKGSKLKLVIQPADATDSSARREIELTRDVVNLNSARAHAAVFNVPGAGDAKVPIGVITLPAFYGPDPSSTEEAKSSATRDVADLLERLKAAGVQGVVLDLRQNGGGYLNEAIDLAGLFIKSGPIVQVRNNYGEVKVDSDEDPSVEYSGPLAILVSKFSASASEIVAGALQDYGRAIVIGDSSTHGKGSVQVPFEMKDLNVSPLRLRDKMGAAKVTIQKFYLPDGHSTQLKGVVPDIVLPSIDEFLPVGEASLPHALAWDEIPSTRFDGKPLDTHLLNSLRTASATRQSSLEEFSYLKQSIDWFKSKQDQKSISLNFEERKHDKEADLAFRKELDRAKQRLEKNQYAFQEFRLGPPLPEKPTVKKEPNADSDQLDDLDSSTEEDKGYATLDVHLREALRIVNDAVELGRKHELWANDHAPLTAAVAAKGS